MPFYYINRESIFSVGKFSKKFIEIVLHIRATELLFKPTTLTI